jgi:acetylornithine deacetylase/succinyl-diaminopimelate desuccinylase-like protein
MLFPTRSSAYARVSQTASQPSVHEAFRWLHLNQQQMLQWQAEMLAIPAPPFGEGPRAGWLEEQFRKARLEQVQMDEVGNVLGLLPATHPGELPREHPPCVLLSAHIDTVFPEGTPSAPVVSGTRIECPGACDNAAGVVALLGLSYALRICEVPLSCDIVFAGNVGEEGEGDLRGIRRIYSHFPWATSIRSHLVLDGAGHDNAISQALGSLRFQVTIYGPGGHSFTDAGTPNPIIALACAIRNFTQTPLPAAPRTTLNIGNIAGGTSVNSIPESATASFDLRSTDPDQLTMLEASLHRAIEDAVSTQNLGADAHRSRGPLDYSIQKIGDRPAASLAADAPILEALRAVDRHLGIPHTPEDFLHLGSTDANIPLSLGIPAVSIGAGGEGGAAHTRGEWYDAARREIGLRRILLFLLSLVEQAATAIE